MNKLKVERDVYKALQIALRISIGDERDVNSMYISTSGWIKPCNALNKLSKEEMEHALLIGYELKRSPEETRRIVK